MQPGLLILSCRKGDAGIYIMVIGETGTGKSTFINTTVNFFRGGSIERGGHDLKIAIPTKFFKATEQEGRKATELDVKQGRVSQTQECTPYLFNYKGRSVTVIDSPGLNDTRGLEQDEKNLAHILKTIEALPHLNALIVTTNGTLERLGVAARNVLSKLRGSIPDVILEHVLIISTNCDPLTANFKVDTLRTDLPGVKIAKDTCYTMQNAAFSSDPRKWADPEHKAAFERLASCWKVTHRAPALHCLHCFAPSLLEPLLQGAKIDLGEELLQEASSHREPFNTSCLKFPRYAPSGIWQTSAIAHESIVPGF